MVSYRTGIAIGAISSILSVFYDGEMPGTLGIMMFLIGHGTTSSAR